jgi:hypothetical protein
VFFFLHLLEAKDISIAEEELLKIPPKVSTAYLAVREFQDNRGNNVLL